VRPESVHLIVADDHDLVREGLRALLDGEPDLQVGWARPRGREALELCRQLRPELVLMDVRMPGTDGLAATRAIKEEFPASGILMLTLHETPDYLLEAIDAGAGGYVLKGTSRQRLIEAVRRTLRGESPLSQELPMHLLRRLASEKKQRPQPLSEPKKRPDLKPEGITPCEVEVLQLLAQGQTNLQIAQNLAISRGTAELHVQHIIAKLGVSDRTQAAVRAIELGLIDPEAERYSGVCKG
jgi:DNA-binding NarL/FixJ family response regulator